MLVPARLAEAALGRTLERSPLPADNLVSVSTGGVDSWNLLPGAPTLTE